MKSCFDGACAEWRGVVMAVLAASVSATARGEGATDTDRSYAAHLAAAHGALRLEEPIEAARWLSGAPESHRGWEWRYLSAQTRQSLGEVGAPVEGEAFSLALHGDRLLVIGTSTGRVILRDRATGADQLTIEAHEGPVYGVAISADGLMLASAGGDRTACTWNATTGEQIARYTGITTPVTSVSFSPDGARIAAANYRAVMEDGRMKEVIGVMKVWDPRTGEEHLSIDAGVKPISMVRWSPDGTRLAASSWGGSVYVARVSDGAIERTLALPEEGAYTALNSVAWSRDGSRIAAGSKDHTARVWDAAGGELIATMKHNAWVLGVDFDPSGAMLATACVDSALRLWSIEGGTLRATMNGHAGTPGPVLYSSDGTELVSSDDAGSVLRWSADPAAYGPAMPTVEIACYAARWSPDGGTLFTCDHNGMVHERDGRTGALRRQWSAHEGSTANTMCLSADGSTLATVSWEPVVRVWDIATGALKREFNAATGVYHAALSPDGALLAVTGPDNLVQLWNVSDGVKVRDLAGCGGGVSHVMFSRDGARVLAASADGAVHQWDAASGEALASYTAGERLLCCVQSPDGNLLVAGAASGKVFAWQVRDGSPLWNATASATAINRLAFSPDGARIAGASTRVFFLDPDHGGVLLSLPLFDSASWDLAFSPDGSRLAVTELGGHIAILDCDRRGADGD